MTDDVDYLSWMTRLALAVVMVVVMLWIRGRIPDDGLTAGVMSAEAATVSQSANPETIEPELTDLTRHTLALMYECEEGGQRSLSSQPCSSSSLLRVIGEPNATSSR